ncbi:MAG: hypothetical protein CPDRYMAC_7041 [uncultured Paraburkholderia sp.]|nr:MAG: hypothetical protein CPDRYDRY_7011 [uncultured Paraburkholderia sp.]CAH2945803.1 MAG: hypothetical protein CPDRYMAC_7041 [uncultured Paraburkholderia sp.]
MKWICCATLMTVVVNVMALPAAADYSSCQFDAQHKVTGELGGTIKDVRQAHLSVRANVLQADIGMARKARRLSEKQADALWKRVDRVRYNADGWVAKQGFLGAGKRATYDRDLVPWPASFVHREDHPTEHAD